MSAIRQIWIGTEGAELICDGVLYNSKKCILEVSIKLNILVYIFGILVYIGTQKFGQSCG